MPAFGVERDEETAAFFDGAARHEFLIVEDTMTGDLLAPQFGVTADPSRYRYVPASGKGSVVSWAVVHQRTDDGEKQSVVGIVQLDEGPWWWTEIQGADADADLFGQAVEVAFEQMGPEVQPYFRVPVRAPKART